MPTNSFAKAPRSGDLLKASIGSIPHKQFAKLPKPARDYIRNYGYRVDGEVLLTIDHDHHMNHSEDANTHWRNGHIVASRDIRKGEEITNNYRLFDAAFCAAFLKPKRRLPRARSRAAQRPRP